MKGSTPQTSVLSCIERPKATYDGKAKATTEAKAGPPLFNPSEPSALAGDACSAKDDNKKGKDKGNGTWKSNNKGKMRGSFAALRMTMRGRLWSG